MQNMIHNEADSYDLKTPKCRIRNLNKTRGTFTEFKTLLVIVVTWSDNKFWV